MAFFSLKPSASCLKKAVLASGLLLVSAQGHADPASEGPFLGLSGHWSGAGTVTMANGATERIRCKAAYAVNATGKAVQQTLRCASDSYRVEISSNVISEGSSLSGFWAETTRGVSGSISGRARSTEIVANVAGAGFTAHLDVRGEAEIFERILAATMGATTILISHRFSTVRHADRICVLEHGRVVELGTHDELMARGGRYHTMFGLQAQRFGEDEEGVSYDVLT